MDETGLTSYFDFRLEWAPDENEVGRTLPVASPDANRLDPSGVSLFTALKSQLGLRLDPTKGPATVLVIDHVEKTPTAN